MSMPIILVEIHKKWLFGLIKLCYIKEDRRPDLIYYEHGKYKHQIWFKIFGTKYSWVLRTNDEYNDLPFVFIKR